MLFTIITLRFVMAKKVLIKRNLIHAYYQLSDDEQIIYSPDMHSESQKQFMLRRLEFLKKKFKNVEVVFEENGQDQVLSSETSYDHVYAWNSYNELQKYKSVGPQNRLFNHDFNKQDLKTFTQFKGVAKGLLRKRFSEALEPIDDDLINHLDFYFEDNQFASTYFATRNGLVGENYSTKMSAHLAIGSLDVKYLYNRVKDYEAKNGKNRSTKWIVFELLWREFFYWHYQLHTTKFFSENGLLGEKVFALDKDYSFASLREMSNHPFWQASLNELESTGYLGNRARQLFASFWIYNLELPWLSGAYFLEVNLIDYDVFSNYGNWMYIAGVGADPRGGRQFDIEKQMQMYDPEGAYYKAWL